MLKVKKEIKQETEVPTNFDANIEIDSNNEPPSSVSSLKRQRKRKSVPVESENSDSNQETKIRVVEDFLQGYGPQLNYTFNLWRENSKVLDRATLSDKDISVNPLKWSIDDVCTFMIKFCDDETAAKFYAQQIDGEALLGLCQDDLIHLMNIKMGPAIKIYNRIMHLRQEVVTKFIEI